MSSSPSFRLGALDEITSSAGFFNLPGITGLNEVAGSRTSFCIDGSGRWLDLAFPSCRDEDTTLHQPHQDAVPQTSHFVDIAPLLRTAAHNLGGFQSTAILQSCQTPPPLRRQPRRHSR